MREHDFRLTAGDLQARYESLRQRHWDGVGGWAMNVFLQEGMCAWVNAWSHHAPDNRRDQSAYASQCPPPKNQSRMDTDAQVGVDMKAFVGLIASLALTTLKGG